MLRMAFGNMAQNVKRPIRPHNGDSLGSNMLSTIVRPKTLLCHHKKEDFLKLNLNVVLVSHLFFLFLLNIHHARLNAN